MKLSYDAMRAIPEIARYLEWNARQKSKGSTAWMGAAASFLRRVAAYVRPEETELIWKEAAHRKTWVAASDPQWFYEDGPMPQLSRDWVRQLTMPNGEVHPVSHVAIMDAMRLIVEQRDKLTAGDDPVLDLGDVISIIDLLDAATREEMKAASKELDPWLCLLIVQYAAFGTIAPNPADKEA